MGGYKMHREAQENISNFLHNLNLDPFDYEAPSADMDTARLMMQGFKVNQLDLLYAILRHSAAKIGSAQDKPLKDNLADLCWLTEFANCITHNLYDQ
tara:strand:- start:1773 stop:2063 length:291 start_codon:yes stop_codon:yes gene_type:complete